MLNMIYIDMPVGTGFSYSETQEGYYSSELLWVEHSYSFLQKVNQCSTFTVYNVYDFSLIYYSHIILHYLQLFVVISQKLFDVLFIEVVIKFKMF